MKALDRSEAPPTKRDVSRYGQFYSDLLDDPSWILRRVETIEMIDLRRIQRHITLDMDMTEVRERAKRQRISLGSEVYLPLTVLAKRIQIDLDSVDASGTVVPIAVSQVDSKIAACIVLSQLDVQSGIFADPEFRAEVWRIIRNADGEAQFLKILQDAVDAPLPTPRQSAWLEASSQPLFEKRLSELAGTYLLTGLVQLSDTSVSVIKFQYHDEISGLPTWRERLGIWPVNLKIAAPGVGSAQREHTRVVVPLGINLEALSLHLGGEPLNRDSYVTRESEDRAVLYTSRLASGNYEFNAYLGVSPRIFAFPALLTSMFSAALLAGALFLQVVDGRFTRIGNPVSDAAVTVLAVVPSLITFYLVREGEHRAITTLLNFDRVILSLSALSSLLVAGAIAVGASETPLFVLIAAALFACGASSLVNYLAVFRPKWRGHRS